MDTAHLLSASLSPVALISACGLVTLALYNRLGAILGRIRAFHQQKLELLENLREHDAEQQYLLLAMLDSQIAGVTAKARVNQKGLYCLLAAIAAFLLCSMFSAIVVLHEWLGVVAWGTQFVGIALFCAGIGWSIRELTLSLTPLEEETAYLEAVATHHLARLQSGKRLRAVKSA